jgi:hypothetical protein
MESTFILLLIGAIAFYLILRNPKKVRSIIAFEPSEAERTNLSFSGTDFKNNINTLKMIAIPIIVIVLLVYGFRSCSDSMNNVKISNREEAFYTSETFLEDYLKAPSTAKFPIYSSSDVNISQIDSITYSVNSWVDAENSFGAMLRSRYFMKLRKVNGSWFMTYLEINGKEMYP